MKEWQAFDIDISQAKGSGAQRSMPCPACSLQRKKSHTPCLSINLEEGLWNCHHCQWSGSLKHGQDKASTPYAHEKHYRKPTYRLTTLPTKVIEWFARRGIPETVLARNRISYGPVYFPQNEEYLAAIQFPYFREGEVLNVKYRGRDKAFRMEGGAERLLYGFDDIAGEQVIITEGEIDKLSCEVAGYTSVVSVPDGAPTPNTTHYARKFDFLLSAETKLLALKRIVLAVETDAPGQRLAEELARRIGPERCYRVQWPDGCKDANDVLVSHGVEQLRTCLETAQPWPVKGLVDVMQLLPAIDLLYTEGLRPGLTPGWPTLRRHYRVRAGELTVVTGVPSHGKTQFLSALAVNLARDHGWRIASFSPEHHPLERYAAVLLDLYTGKSFGGPDAKMSQAELGGGLAWLHEHFSFILPDEDELPTIPHLLSLAKVLVYQRGIQGLILDPWNEIEHHRPDGMNETEYISQALSLLRRFARQHSVHIWIVAHPYKLMKATKGPYEGKYAPPTPYEISGSAHWRNKADNCLAVWRDVESDTTEVEVHVQKIRYRENGKPGVVTLRFDAISGRYQDAQVPHLYEV